MKSKTWTLENIAAAALIFWLFRAFFLTRQHWPGASGLGEFMRRVLFDPLVWVLVAGIVCLRYRRKKKESVDRR